MLKSPLGRPARTINMNELGYALTELGHAGDSPSIQALFVYNCNAAAVAPDSNRVLAGLRREDLFTVVHEQFFTDTVDFADIVLPATTFLEHKELMGAYGHYMVQISDRAIEPLGEARTNADLFAELGRRMGFMESAFLDSEDDLIAQALDTPHPWMAGITPESLAREKQKPLDLPRNDRGEVLPFTSPEWFPLPGNRAALLPVPVWSAPEESPADVKESSPEEEFPLQFLPRKADNYMNTTFANLPVHQSMERRTQGVLEMHPSDASARLLVNGEPVAVFNRRGAIELAVRVTEAVPCGVVAARLDWQKLSADGQNVNALTSQRLTDLGGGATFYSVMVEVRKLGQRAGE